MKKAMAKLPIEIHIFSHRKKYYAFDVRNFTIIKINAQGAAVLSQMSKNFSLEQIIKKLRKKISIPLINSFFLKFLLLIQKGVFSISKISLAQRPPFHRLVIMLAGGCNMSCTYCFEKNVPIHQKPNLLNKKRADQILEWFFRYHEGKKAHIQLYGGEPLLNWPMLVYIIENLEKWASEKKIALSKYLITNGTLLTREYINYLKKHDIEIQVSVDGSERAHNLFRIFKTGKPTMSCVKKNIRELLSQDANFNLRAVLTPPNKNPNAVIRSLHKLGTEKVSFEVISSEQNKMKFSRKDWQLFNKKYRTFLYKFCEGWNELPAEMQSIITHICECQRVFYGCGAGVTEVTIDPDGNIYSCQRLYGKSSAHVENNLGPAEFTADFLTVVDKKPICQKCWARYLCGGGCLQQSYMEQKNGKPIKEYCVMKRNLIEASIVRIAEIRENKENFKL